jgi:3-hydroxyacyl-CoA dehydrogenase
MESSMTSHLERLLQWYQQKMSAETVAEQSKPIQTVAIIGAGLMGIEIAAQNVRHGLRLRLTDKDPQTLAAAPERIRSELAECVSPLSNGKGPGVSTIRVEQLVELVTDDDRLGDCDLILETVVENPSVKRQVYSRIEPRLANHSILATNTSTIPVGELAAELAAPGRFCGIHFCHPVRINPLVEIIPGQRTEPAILAAAVAYAKMLGKLPLVVEDGPGFLVNRLLLRYTDEAMHLLMDGAGIEQIDRAAEEFGMALGPLRIMDEIGLDTSLAAGRVLLRAFPDRVAALPLLPLLVKRKQLGQKSGGGFYVHSPAAFASALLFEKPVGPNPEALAIIEHYAKRHNPPSDEMIRRRLLLAMLLESTLILQEKRRLDPREIDLCLLCGLGFPPAEGGLLHWADERSPAKVLEWINSLEPLGKRFQPTPLLREIVKTNRRFCE